MTVPGRLKFCSSLGPTVSGAAEFDVGGADVADGAAWASATAGARATAPATKTVLMRKTALIRSRSSVIAASVPRGEQAIARRVPFIQALGR